MYKRRLVFWSACMGMLLFGITFITLGAVVPGLKAKFGLDDLTAGTLFSILPFGILAGSLVFGPVCDKSGYKILLSVSCFCIGAGLEGIAYAPSTDLLKISIFFFGLGGGAINGATNALVSDISSNEKSANLSLLGVSFGVGALGMPVLIGLLENVFDFTAIVATVGLVTLAVGIFLLLIRFPPAKHTQGFPIAKGLSLLKDSLLLLIGFYLFCQSSFEAIINNWTTTYLTERLTLTQSNALYALSLFVAGMTVMRILMGSIFRATPVSKMLFASFILIFAGCLFLEFGRSFVPAVAGLIILGAGLAGGFPLMLGLAGHRFAALSGTDLSIILVIALAGNMLVNYMMGVVAHKYGIRYMTSFTFAELAVMCILGLIILKKTQINNSN
jgi:FHS family glucose/mannose:H+ symporter-like MFS transporter